MARKPPSSPPGGLYEPGWLASLAFAALATLAVCFPVWPGFMSFDSVFAYRQAQESVQTMIWPPLHTYMFWLSDRAGLASGGVLVFQTFLLFASAGLILHLLVRNRIAALVLCGLFAALFIVFPTLLGSMLVHWRDVPTTSFALAGVALWLLAARYGAPLLLAPAAAAFGCAVALRYNAVVLIAFILLAFAWAPLLGRPSRFARPFAILCVCAALATAWASTQWRLPDLKRMPPVSGFAATQAFDLVGISACADKDYMPLGMTGGVPLSAYHIRRNYNPQHMNLTFMPKPGVPPISDNDRDGKIPAAWRDAILKEPACYLSHRTTVFVEQMGLAEKGVFYATHIMIDPNPYGLTLAHKPYAELVGAYVMKSADPLWRRPVWLYAIAAALAGIALLRDRRQAPLLLALLGGAFAYAGILFLVSPAADARYIFPSNAVCALLIAASLGIVAQGRRA
jgi:hypothetical protein